MNQIGELLKKAREEQKLTLEQVAQKTKIHIHKLQAIEDGRMDLLPAKVFTIGLVKSYARLLKVDQELFNKLCIETFDFHPEVMELSHLPNNEAPIETQPVGRFQIPKALSIFLSIVVSIALLFVIYYVINKMKSYSSEEEVSTQQFNEKNSGDTTEKIEIKEPRPETKPIDSSQVTATTEKAYPHNGATVTDTTTKELIVEKKQIESPTQLEEKSKTPEILKTTALLEKSEQKTAAIEPINEIKIDKKNEAQSNPISEDNITNEDLSASQVVHSDNKLSITSLEPVRVEIIWSDGYVQVMLMKSNETKTLVFSTPILVKVNNGGAVKISYNDRPYRIPGIFNQSIDLKYP